MTKEKDVTNINPPETSQTFTEQKPNPPKRKTARHAGIAVGMVALLIAVGFVGAISTPSKTMAAGIGLAISSLSVLIRSFEWMWKELFDEAGDEQDERGKLIRRNLLGFAWALSLIGVPLAAVALILK